MSRIEPNAGHRLKEALRSLFSSYLSPHHASFQRKQMNRIKGREKRQPWNYVRHVLCTFLYDGGLITLLITFAA